MKVCVFCGSSLGNDEKLVEEARKLGKLIAETGNDLVFGGSDCGIMSVIAHTVKDFGGKIYGVQIRKFQENGRTAGFSDYLDVVETFQERKYKLIAGSDILITFPGGMGTLDEFTDAFISINFTDLNRKLVLLNLDGFYDEQLEFFNKMVEKGFLRKELLDTIIVLNNVEEVKTLLK